MKLIAFSISVSFLAVMPAIAKPVTVSEVLELRQQAGSSAFAARAEWNALTFYLQGVVEGAGSYQEALRKRGQPVLFCPPREHSYSIEGMYEFLENAALVDAGSSAVSVIIEGYAQQYPCGN